jgi:hypothetical protein
MQAAPVPAPIPHITPQRWDNNIPLPGTLGKTYQRPSRMIPHDKHPRIGMVDIEVVDNYRIGLEPSLKLKVTARDIYNHFPPLEGYADDDGVWHFESEPLLPTVPHIYDVRVELIKESTRIENHYGRNVERKIEENKGTIAIRRIRLIPGRIVDLMIY